MAKRNQIGRKERIADGKWAIGVVGIDAYVLAMAIHKPYNSQQAGDSMLFYCFHYAAFLVNGFLPFFGLG
jgi:hypothetical protein